MRDLARISAAGVVALAGLAAVAAEQLAPPEPEGYWTGPLHGPTPETLAGAAVIDLAGLDRLAPEKPLLVDVGPSARKPANLPAGAIWSPSHRSIPGAVWMPGAGEGDLDPAGERRMLAQVAARTNGARTAPVVAFCQPRCWGSWNLGKRLVNAGYTKVFWFPGGTDAWQERRDTAAVKPLEGWEPAAPPGPAMPARDGAPK